MSKAAYTDASIRVADLNQNRATTFDLSLKPGQVAALAEDLELSTLKKLSFKGEIRAFGKADWELRGKLGATVSQPCVVTLEPVTTRIDDSVERRFLSQMPTLDGEEEEVETPEDENAEALQATIDLLAVLHESLALLIPQFPRAKDAELQETVFTEDGKKPMTDEDARPFAGLAGLRDQLSSKDNE
ncbi:YceD family protein [Shimia sp. NS0008-38b]|uniref:YceD family protein n=1 Tax=Shimia sp. NS0008-38b TaxID=3127653 RepID=UPI00310977D2